MTVDATLRVERIVALLLFLAALGLGARGWLEDHPQHNPWAPLDIDHPPGWATRSKLAAANADPRACREVLQRGAIGFSDLPPAGSGACLRDDRLILAPDRERGLALVPADADARCAVHLGLAMWLRHEVNPAAERLLGSPVARLEHYGTNSCRRIGAGSHGRWSEHATGNAIDIAAFVLADGTAVSVLRDWGGDPAKAAFLRAARDGACRFFGTTLSPDYNAAHADHLHLDQASRGGFGYCR